MTESRSFTDDELELLDQGFEDGLQQGRAETGMDLDLLVDLSKLIPQYNPGEGTLIAALRTRLREHGIETF